MKHSVEDLLSAMGERTTTQNIKRVTRIVNSSEKYREAAKWNLMGDYVKSIEGDKEEIVKELKSIFEKQDAERKAAEEEQRNYDKEAAKILITSGYTFEGYNIVKYSGYISGDDCITMPRNNFWGNKEVPNYLCGSLVKIRRQALKELKEAALDLGCNAVIGVDFDYLVMDPQHGATLNNQGTIYEPYVICVTANGTAVKIVKDGYVDEEEILDSEVVSDIAEELPEL